MKDIPTISSLKFSDTNWKFNSKTKEWVSVRPMVSFINRDEVEVFIYKYNKISGTAFQNTFWVGYVYSFYVFAGNEMIVLEKDVDEERANEFIKSQILPLI